MNESINLCLPEDQEAAVDGGNFLHRRDLGEALSRCGVPWVELESTRTSETIVEAEGYCVVRSVFKARSPYICLGCWDLDRLRSQGVETREVPRPAPSWPGAAR